MEESFPELNIIKEKYSHMSDEEFLRDVVAKSYVGIGELGFVFAIYDLDGKIVMANKGYSRYYGFDNPADIFGLTLPDLARSLVQKTSPLRTNGITDSIYHEMIDEWEHLRQKVICTEEVISYINVMPFIKGTLILQGYHIPIWNPHGKLIGTMTISASNNVFHDTALLRNRVLNKAGSSLKPKKISLPELTALEYKIVLLLSLGFSQQDVAKLLHLVRGTVASIISERISPKLGLHGSNTKMVVDMLLDIGYFNHMPNDMIPPILIETHI